MKKKLSVFLTATVLAVSMIAATAMPETVSARRCIPIEQVTAIKLPDVEGIIMPKGMPVYGTAYNYDMCCESPVYPKEYGQYHGERLRFTPYDFYNEGLIWKEVFGEKYGCEGSYSPTKIDEDQQRIMMSREFDRTDGYNDYRNTIMRKGQTLDLDTNYDDVADSALVYTTSDKSVATVTSGGVVKAKKKGIVVITATITGQKFRDIIPIDMHRFLSVKLTITVRNKGDKGTKYKFLKIETKKLGKYEACSFNEYDTKNSKGLNKIQHYLNDVLKNYAEGVTTKGEAEYLMSHISYMGRRNMNDGGVTGDSGRYSIGGGGEYGCIKSVKTKNKSELKKYCGMVYYDKKSELYYVFKSCNSCHNVGAMMYSCYNSWFGYSLYDKYIDNIDFFKDHIGTAN